MPTVRVGIIAGLVLCLVAGGGYVPAGQGAEVPDLILPPGVKAVWDPAKAFHERTATRERVCLNGLWQWQPAEVQAGAVPAGQWGYFKVPGGWPGITDYMQKDCQTVFAHPAWSNAPYGVLIAAWYQREFTVPSDWTGRRITLHLDHLNSYAAV